MPSCETVQQLFCHILFLASAFICKLFLIEVIYLWRNLGSSIWINSQPHDALPFFQIGFTCSAPHFFVTLDIVRFVVLKVKELDQYLPNHLIDRSPSFVPAELSDENFLWNDGVHSMIFGLYGFSLIVTLRSSLKNE